MEDDRSFVTSSRDGTKVAVESTDVADVDEATSEAADDTTGAVVVVVILAVVVGAVVFEDSPFRCCRCGNCCCCCCCGCLERAVALCCGRDFVADAEDDGTVVDGDEIPKDCGRRGDDGAIEATLGGSKADAVIAGCGGCSSSLVLFLDEDDLSTDPSPASAT